MTSSFGQSSDHVLYRLQKYNIPSTYHVIWRDKQARCGADSGGAATRVYGALGDC